ncbi:unnamed protein product [Sphenostylis stenocarpa]|uniref:Uncharacterized protein n=1 Tax=Sphenostylis stenocarpa TaxID=92480 RepID=A0AA86STK9_9FABA|nr:unnamed protein product [Sphenostylis stenocarpa]
MLEAYLRAVQEARASFVAFVKQCVIRSGDRNDVLIVDAALQSIDSVVVAGFDLNEAISKLKLEPAWHLDHGTSVVLSKR